MQEAAAPVGDHEQRRAGGQLVLQVADVCARIDVDRVPAQSSMRGLVYESAAGAA